MSPGSKVRLTTPTRIVLDLLLAAADDPPWGYRICSKAGLGSGTVYPILERLEQAGWITGVWENGQPTDRPRRRLYSMTADGRAAYAAAIAQRRTFGAWRLQTRGEFT